MPNLILILDKVHDTDMPARDKIDCPNVLFVHCLWPVHSSQLSSLQTSNCTDLLGFEHNTYAVRETESSVEVCVVSRGPVLQEPVRIQMVAIEGSARS